MCSGLPGHLPILLGVQVFPNYRWARVPIPSGFRVDAWERYWQGFPDTRLIHYLKFDFPLSLKRERNLSTSEVKNTFQLFFINMQYMNILIRKF